MPRSREKRDRGRYAQECEVEMEDTAAVRVRETVRATEERTADTNPIDSLLTSKEADLVRVQRDDIFDKALEAPSGKFRKIFQGRAASHRGISWGKKKRS